jgi:hypothetical protein
MGDRSNIAIAQFNNTDLVYLYSHWMGGGIIKVCHDVLARNARWDDAPYLARMLFDEMTKDAINRETGFGISANAVCDNDYPIIYLNPNSQEAFLIGLDNKETKRVSFDAFVELSKNCTDHEELVNRIGLTS